MIGRYSEPRFSDLRRLIMNDDVNQGFIESNAIAPEFLLDPSRLSTFHYRRRIIY